MGKITVKHYLNTNLKPYIIKGENYYSIYVMVVINRKNTKVKSISFEELYTENDFEEIQNENNDMIKQEIAVIENVCLLTQNFLGDFDASFFSAYYSFLHDIFIDEIDFELYKAPNYHLFSGKNNKLNIAMEPFIFGDFSLSVNKTHGMDLFTWFSENGQSELSNYLRREAATNIQDCIGILNKYVFLGSMNALSLKLQETKKGREIYDKYSDSILYDFDFYAQELRELYQVN